MDGKKREMDVPTQNGAAEPVIDKSTSEPPPYYNSEPSSQPPQYNKPPGRKSGAGSSNFQQHASAASVNAILASPEINGPEKKKEKLPWRQRWKEWRQSWEVHDDHESYERDYGSQPKLNYWGARADGRETKARKNR